MLERFDPSYSCRVHAAFSSPLSHDSSINNSTNNNISTTKYTFFISGLQDKAVYMSGVTSNDSHIQLFWIVMKELTCSQLHHFIHKIFQDFLPVLPTEDVDVKLPDNILSIMKSYSQYHEFPMSYIPNLTFQDRDHNTGIGGLLYDSKGVIVVPRTQSLDHMYNCILDLITN